MSLVHLHLVLNHMPVIGLLFTLVVFFAALWRKNDGFAKLGLVMLAGIGLVATFVYFTGEPAEEAVERLAGISERAIERHEEIAQTAFIVSSLVGLLSLGLLVSFRRTALPRWAVGVCFVATLAASGFMALTAYLGGQIRHTEIAGVVGTVPSADDDDR